MPKVSRESASQVRDFEMTEDRTEELDGYSVSFVSIRQTHDLLCTRFRGVRFRRGSSQAR